VNLTILDNFFYSAILASIFSFFALFIIFNISCHYIESSFFPASSLPPVASVDDLLPVCKICFRVKSHRVHHCKICDRCVRLFDHHCPFTANCVGENNFRAFWLWLTFNCFGLIYSSAMSWQSFNYCILNRKNLPLYSTNNMTFADSRQFLFSGSNNFNFSSSDLEFSSSPKIFWSLNYCRSLGNSSWIFLLVVFGLLSVGLLWTFETWLINKNLTTVEFIVGLGKKAKIHVDEEEILQNYSRISVNANYLADSEFVIRSKSWFLIHRGENFFRLFFPDFVWKIFEFFSSALEKQK